MVVVVVVVMNFVVVVLLVVIEPLILDISSSLLWPIGVGRRDMPVASYSYTMPSLSMCHLTPSTLWPDLRSIPS